MRKLIFLLNIAGYSCSKREYSQYVDSSGGGLNPPNEQAAKPIAREIDTICFILFFLPDVADHKSLSADT